jgi:hypothetical protein
VPEGRTDPLVGVTPFLHQMGSDRLRDVAKPVELALAKVDAAHPPRGRAGCLADQHPAWRRDGAEASGDVDRLPVPVRAASQGRPRVDTDADGRKARLRHRLDHP